MAEHSDDIDYTWDTWPRLTLSVEETRPEVKVTYHNEGGARFRIRVRQKSNPVGFRARLPGDRR